MSTEYPFRRQPGQEPKINTTGLNETIQRLIDQSRHYSQYAFTEPVKPDMTIMDEVTQKSIKSAEHEAKIRHDRAIKTDHVLLGLVRRNPAIRKMLEEKGADYRRLGLAVPFCIDLTGTPAPDPLPLSYRTQKVLTMADSLRREQHEELVTPLDVMIGLAVEDLVVSTMEYEADKERSAIIMSRLKIDPVSLLVELTSQ